MEHLYIDESGSMTKQYADRHPHFVITIIRTEDQQKLKQIYKRFVSKHLKELAACDTNGKMFKDGKFHELKGSCFTPKLKKDFIKFFCRNDRLEIFYIVIDNTKIESLYKNTARAFNYVLTLALEYFIKKGFLSNGEIIIHLDERNEKPEARYFLQEHINTQLVIPGIIKEDVKVEYFDSANNRMVQVADVFSNIYFSELKTGKYTDEIGKIKAGGYLKFIFKFPL